MGSTGVPIAQVQAGARTLEQTWSVVIKVRRFSLQDLKNL